MQALKLNESTVSNRVVYIWSVLSNGTSPAQFETGGQPTMSVAGLPKWNSAGTLLAINTVQGEYCTILGTSDVSVAGPGVVYYSSASALETSYPIQVVAYNPYDATNLGTSISTFDPSVLSVGLKAVLHSGATVQVAAGVFTLAPGSYSSVTVSVGAIAPATYSGVTVGVNSIAATTYSGVTVGVNNIGAGTYSGVTVGINNILAGTYSGVTVGIGSASTAAGNTLADALLLRNVVGGVSSGRTVGEALALLRNKVAVDGSTLTVYLGDDVTSFWTGSVATVSTNSGLITKVAPH